jgi:thiamine biosynthesis lipoprotein
VVALDAQRADGLATELCVIPPREGIAMIDSLPDAACLLVTAGGEQLRSRSFNAVELRQVDPAAPTWPKNHVVNLRFQLTRSETQAPFHRHYVGAWVADEHGRRVRILALWAKPSDIRYARDLDLFWRDAWVLAGEGENTRKMLGFTRATRPPGSYTLSWDGLDDAGRPVPRGRYTLHLDVNREKGPTDRRELHTHAAVELICGDQSQSAVADDQPELRDVIASYGPVGGDH